MYGSYFGLMRLVLIQLFPWSTTQSMSSKSWGYLPLREIMGTFLHSILLNMCGKIRAETKGKRRLTSEVTRVSHFFEFLKRRDDNQVEMLKEEIYYYKENFKQCKTCTIDI